ncbi:hypothetical protein RB653_000868 [Dictyostelium firmibasis]|uniref:PRA1 family protein n=1 Tax=Dictyostelium firmibasis TaxID=79012 RepID=A0AAN7TVY9_9MYCE
MPSKDSIKVQPWNDFIEWGRYSIPGNQITTRMEDNLNFYSGNYLIIVAVVLLLTLFTNINLLVSILLLGGIGYYLFVVQKGDKNIGFAVLTPLIQMVILGVVSVVVVYKLSGLTLFYTTLISLLFVLAHSAFKMRNLKNKASNVINGIKNDLKNELN